MDDCSIVFEEVAYNGVQREASKGSHQQESKRSKWMICHTCSVMISLGMVQMSYEVVCCGQLESRCISSHAFSAA